MTTFGCQSGSRHGPEGCVVDTLCRVVGSSAVCGPLLSVRCLTSVSVPPLVLVRWSFLLAVDTPFPRTPFLFPPLVSLPPPCLPSTRFATRQSARGPCASPTEFRRWHSCRSRGSRVETGLGRGWTVNTPASLHTWTNYTGKFTSPDLFSLGSP